MRGIQRIHSTVAVVIRTDPHLVTQLEGNVPPTEGDILAMPQGDTRDGGPGLLMRHQPVLHQPKAPEVFCQAAVTVYPLLQCCGATSRKQSPLFRERAEGSTRRTWTCRLPVATGPS
ncbi:hypothetical protein F7725_003141 [Dissostichus mawsoni]|uniref:Uncharacterized protein n=1 Tax=Dissostichus mawsoni TaxID=36200 RepID=A0A7J5YA71_DISMA|nr:hypothetical protein F7725_003141 [Dissostichus mawsoni]